MTLTWIVGGLALGKPPGYCSPHGNGNIFILLTMPEVDGRKSNVFELETPRTSFT
jgi:hypothetical protein